MTVRLSKELKTKLERLAASTRRSKSYLAAEAIAEYVELNAWQVEEIGKAVEKADAGGPFVRDGDVDPLPRLTCARGEPQAAQDSSGHASRGWRPLAQGRACGRHRDLPVHRGRQPEGCGTYRRAHPGQRIRLLAELPHRGRPGRWAGTRELDHPGHAVHRAVPGQGRSRRDPARLSRRPPLAGGAGRVG